MAADGEEAAEGKKEEEEKEEDVVVRGGFNFKGLGYIPAMTSGPWKFSSGWM